MINRVILVGRLTADPELRKTNTDKSVVSFTLAVDNRQKAGADGKKTASFIPVVAWNDLANNVAEHVHKGSLVGVDGRLNQRSYDRKDGNKAYVLEVIADSVQFLEPKGKNESASTSINEEPANNVDENVDSTEIADDDLPF